MAEVGRSPGQGRWGRPCWPRQLLAALDSQGLLHSMPMALVLGLHLLRCSAFLSRHWEALLSLLTSPGSAHQAAPPWACCGVPPMAAPPWSPVLFSHHTQIEVHTWRARSLPVLIVQTPPRTEAAPRSLSGPPTWLGKH